MDMSKLSRKSICQGVWSTSKEHRMMNGFFFRNGTATKCKCVLRCQHYLQPQLHPALEVKAAGQPRISRQTCSSEERQETHIVIVGDK